jgi:hypothetical protein
MLAGCYWGSYRCKLVSLSCVHQIQALWKINTDTYYCRPKRDGILFKLYGMLSPPSRSHFQRFDHSPVYGVLFIQVFEAAADSIGGYATNSKGWSQASTYDPSPTPDALDVVASVAANLPTLTDALSESQNYTSMTDINNVSHSWIRRANVFHMENLYVFQVLFWHQDQSNDVRDLYFHNSCELFIQFR